MGDAGSGSPNRLRLAVWNSKPDAGWATAPCGVAASGDDTPTAEPARPRQRLDAGVVPPPVATADARRGVDGSSAGGPPRCGVGRKPGAATGDAYGLPALAYGDPK